MAVEFLPGNRLTLLRSGVEYFPALEAAIREAQREIFLETYIYAGDATGERITKALCEAARRGVAAHVLVDGFGSRDMPAEFARELRDAGARLLVFRPEVWRFPFRRDRLRRMHRKIAVADGRVAFVGGINIIDDMDTPRPVPPRVERAGSQRAALAVRDNLRHRRDIEEAYLAAIASAQEEIIIASAYFFPGRRFRRALVGAAARRVRVVVLLQGRVEYVLLHYASHALYGPLLEAGVEIYEYHKSFMHAKVAVVDGHWATVGSSNIDPFSLMLAREANAVVEDRRFGAELRAKLRADIEHGARVVARTRWFRQPLRRRIPMWIGYGLARLAIGVFGFGGRF